MYTPKTRKLFVRRKSETSLPVGRNSSENNCCRFVGLQSPHMKRSFTPKEHLQAVKVARKVKLPERFESKLLAKKGASPAIRRRVTKTAPPPDSDDDVITVEWKERKRDVDRALQWIKQELVSLVPNSPTSPPPSPSIKKEKIS